MIPKVRPKSLGIILGLAMGGLGVLYYRLVRRPLPKRSGQVVLPGLDGPAEVLWDRWGVPHAYAQTQDDAFFLQGYLHAQDRLWQMEMNRRIGSGRLSELFGRRTLEADRFLRRVGLRRAAQKEVGLLDATATPVLAAYCSGVNAFLRSHRDRLPLEFSLLRFRPEPWTPVDSLTWAKLMGWSLSLNWDVELFRSRFIVDLGPEAASQIETPYPDGHPLTTPVGGTQSGQSDNSSKEFRALGSMLSGGFSNSWVVSGQRSETGKPLLASDPHLIPQLPSPWYEMHLECPEFRMAGATMPGAPGTVIGHNERIAWGMTAGMADTQDLYMEEFSQEEPHKYRHKGRWRRATVVQERIRVKGQLRPETEEVLATLHGPVLFPAKERPQKAFALRSALLEPNQLLRAGLGLAKAKDWDDFRAALSDWAAPAVNFLYADVAGNIGYQFAGRVPQRRASNGLVPVPGWTGEHEWQGYLAQTELPWAYNPPEGYLVNANNKLTAGAGTTPIAGEWIDGYRAKRIQDLILEKGVLSKEDFRDMHMDVLSLPALELKKLLKEVRVGSPQAQRALETLLGWDGKVTAESRGAAMYEAFRLRLLRNLLSPLLGSRTDDYFEMQLHPLASTSVYQFRGASFFLERLRQLLEGKRGPGSPSQDPGEVIARSLEEAAADLRGRLGGDESRWSWGRLHRVTFRHVLGQSSVVAPLLNHGPYPLVGDADTVHQAAYSLRYPYEAARWLPSYRLIADTADWDRSLSVHVPGQSGQPASPHYDDLVPLWLRGEYHPMPFSRMAVEGVTATKQSFLPSPAD